MDRGIYAASSGGLVNSRKIELVANNLANINTAGFKAERMVSKQQSFSDTLAGQLYPNDPKAIKDQNEIPGAVDVESYTDFSQGPIRDTGNPLDVALSNANQFFVVDTPEGEAYTRAGNFTLNAEGALVTQDGLPVQGDGGALTLPNGAVKILGNGAVTVNGRTVGNLRVVEIEDSQALKRTEGARFKLESGGAVTAVPPELVPQSLEMANINVVEAMVEMISAQRSFEAYTKTVQTIDDLNSQAIRTATGQGA